MPNVLGSDLHGVGSVVVEGVSKGYGQELRRKQVIKDCSVAIEPNRLTAMIGPSGCGKSTLIRLIAGFDKPDGGVISIDRKGVVGPGSDRLVVFQESALFPWMTVYENVMYGPVVRGRNNAETRQYADALLERVGLQSFRNRFPTQLSGGMQRRAELARAMINKPSIMILDEPFRGLDAMTKVLMWEYYSTLFSETRITSLFVTTDIDEAIFMADRLIVMTNIPTSVYETFEINVPRPRRRSTLLEDEDINNIKKKILSILASESMRSFDRSSSASIYQD